jgi:hypothetical protein
MQNIETIEQFLARGGQIQVCSPMLQDDEEREHLARSCCSKVRQRWDWLGLRPWEVTLLEGGAAVWRR